jgi:hypothetical protein
MLILSALAASFAERHIQAQSPPPIDGTDATRAHFTGVFSDFWPVPAKQQFHL